MKYRKKPVEIEAVHWQPDVTSGVISSFVEIPADASWLLMATISGTAKIEQDGCLSIKTLEGVMRANPGDWIIRGVKGELYPCKPDVFALTYEPVHD